MDEIPLVQAAEGISDSWYSSKKICKWARNQTFSIYDIEEVRADHHSEVTLENRSDYNFSIIFKGRKKNLDLVANSAKEAQDWINGLNNLKKYYTRKEWREKNCYMVRYQLEGPNRVKAYVSCPACSRAARSSIAAGLKVPPATSSWMR
ncbi:1-phosphatidylinositol 4,5-bisphosphate phosphodiesterase delta-4-like isoform X3 [Mobula birostris]|uniref:1-phosphatidylinositol 4,5-bisphosphate phosphodiesterase delta-4-like isoform X3 n=1 Tax=Mobula birostris TaxID=1983395 RepID=UPI003B27F83D